MAQTQTKKRWAVTGILLLLAVITCFVLGWKFFQPSHIAEQSTDSNVKHLAVAEKCCECDNKKEKKVVRKPVKKEKKKKKKKAYVAPSAVAKKKKEEKKSAPIVAAISPKVEEKKPELEKKVLAAPQSKAEAGFDPSSCGEGSEAVWSKEEKKYECRAIATASPLAAAQPQYQLGSVCHLSDGAQGIVTHIYPNGNLQCSEVVLVPVPSKSKAVAQYIVCTTAGAAVGYYNGGTYSAISGGVGGAGGTYAGRELFGENGGWLGCATGPTAGLIKFGGKSHRGASTAATGPSGGGAGIGETVVGGGGGLN